jgi:hypothetical protein
LQLFYDIFHVPVIRDSSLCKVEFRAAFLLPAVLLEASVLIDDLITGAISAAKMASELKLRTLVQIMIVHVFFDDAKSATEVALATLLFVLLKLIIGHDLIAPSRLVPAIKIDRSDQTKQVLVFS